MSEEERQAKLVFVTSDTTVGVPGVYTMNLDGSELTPVAVKGDTVFFPGPWGQEYIIGETTGPSLLLYPRWSPDGKKLVAQLMWAFEGYVIMVMNEDGTNKHVLWQVRSAAKRPQWSPEGDRLLFMRSGALGVVFARGIVDANGQNDRDFMRSDEGQHIFEGDTVWFGGDFQWGPTGQFIYATAQINEKNEIFNLDSETGTVIERMTHNDIDEEGFRLSRDGKYATSKSGKYGYTNKFLVLSLEDGGLIEIPIDNTVDYFWNWSSDSKKIVFAKDENPDPYRNEDYYLYMVDIDEPTEIVKLTSFQAVNPDLFISTVK